MSSPPRSTVLITGASSGIGKATALYLARRGYHVLASSRELGRLDELMAQGGAESLPISAHQLDVNDQVSVAAVVPRILDQVGALDALINNAGYGLWGCLEDLTMEEVKVQFETNLFAVLRMSQAVLPHMRERRRGTIINVGSVAGRIGSPGGGAICRQQIRPGGPDQGLADGGVPIWHLGGTHRTRPFSHQLSPGPGDGAASAGPPFPVL